MTPEFLRAALPLTARHHATEMARVALHWAFFPVIFWGTLASEMMKREAK